MALNTQKGNMYIFVTHTWNTCKGKCPHNCKYCYMKAFTQKELRFDKKEMDTDLGEKNYIFVGSSCDMFADEVPEQWILDTLEHCDKYYKNMYLFQSKNPKRMYAMKNKIPEGSVIGTTIETNRTFPDMGEAPNVEERAFFMGQLTDCNRDFNTMVTIEPVLDFDVNELASLIRICKPSWVNIGADSKGHKMPEPSKEKILELIEELKKFTKIKMKTNLKRLGVTDESSNN